MRNGLKQPVLENQKLNCNVKWKRQRTIPQYS